MLHKDDIHLLKSPLQCGGKTYRAYIKRGKMGAVLVVQQPMLGGWHPTGGSWYVKTLLNDLSDSIYIDFGQGWKIDSGMCDAVIEACKWLAQQHDDPSKKF